jgi:alpha-tubulin suppressor-like RCC1 family protein
MRLLHRVVPFVTLASLALASVTGCSGGGVTGDGGMDGGPGDGGDAQSDGPPADAGPLRITQLSSSGLGYTLALASDGTVWSWGINDFGQLARTATAMCTVSMTTSPCDAHPARAMGLPAFVQLASGNGHACGRTASGEVHCWGLNESGELGQGGSDLLPHPMAMRVTLPMPARAIVAGSFHTCAILNDGSVSCWGANNFAQLGTPSMPGPMMCADGEGNTIPCATTPIAVPGLAGVTQLGAGRFYTCALAANGVSCWGLNDNAQLGIGPPDMNEHAMPAMLTLSGATQLGAGSGAHACAVTADHTAHCWGLGAFGQLGVDMASLMTCAPGSGDFLCAPMPVAVPGFAGATFVAPGRFHTCALVTGAQVACAGRDDDGQAGPMPAATDTCSDGFDTFPCHRIPVAIPGLSNAVGLTTGEFHSCALLMDGSVHCWGRNDFGQLGDGTMTHAFAPVTVAGLPMP